MILHYKAVFRIAPRRQREVPIPGTDKTRLVPGRPGARPGEIVTFDDQRDEDVRVRNHLFRHGAIIPVEMKAQPPKEPPVQEDIPPTKESVKESIPEAPKEDEPPEAPKEEEPPAEIIPEESVDESPKPEDDPFEGLTANSLVEALPTVTRDLSHKLAQMGVEVIEDLGAISDEELRKLHGVGPMKIKELRDAYSYLTSLSDGG